MVLVSIVIFILILGAGLLGLWAHKRLPEAVKDDSARSVVGQVTGIVSLLLALVLGTLIGTSFGFFGTQKTELEMLSSQILMLDQALAQFGPDTKPARDRLKESVQTVYETFWGDRDPDPKLLSVTMPLASAQATKAFLATLKPETDAQKQALASANLLTNQIMQGRVMIDLQVASHPISSGMLTVLTIWAVILFFAMGLFVKQNGLVVAAMAFGAICVAFAIFLILELGLPYTGLFRVSGAALHTVLETIDN
ncbi:hypothetical protein DFR50_12240 [Roseiarcus fermentans]|uniref:DUF4239 domain-containing protein n=1 Tax=Roseiarcus fermentans TaxID=1473586 RepID=A0A366F3G9_9HYPH|nr:DUF4239 domain-containing protein [Roseiarcus fermentans]RBP09203.1 hypothetical protein DFR50_12240 [Roseiarcus fermentans]